MVTAEGAGSSSAQRLARHLSSEFDLFWVPMDPAVEMTCFERAKAIVVHAGQRELLALVECARVRQSGLPVGLVTGRPLDEAVIARAGVAVALVEPAGEVDVIRFGVRLLATASTESSTPISTSAKQFELGPGVCVDRFRRTLIVNGREHALSAQKFDLLCYLIDHQGTAVGAAELVRCGILRPTQAQRFKGLIHELKAHLGPNCDRLRAVPGYGYRLDLG